MLARLGTGPVFTYEWLITSRRRQVYAARSLFVTVLLGGLAVVWWAEVAKRSLTSFQELATVGKSFYQAIVGIQLTLILTAAPAAMAGAICVDKSRGTLAHVLVTDLSNAEIVLGKLAARLVSVLGFLACTWPVLALGSLLGGIDPSALAGAFLVALGLALLSSSLALTLSVWARQPYEVLFATYSILAIWLLARPTSAYALNMGWQNWLSLLDPIGLTFEPTVGTKGGLTDPALFLLLCVLASALLTIIAVWRVRSVAIRQAGQGRSAPTRRVSRAARRIREAMRGWPAPSLDDNPVLWREWHRHRPSTWMFVFWMLYTAIAGAFTVGTMFAVSTNGGATTLPAWVNGFQTSIGFLLLAVVASSSLAEERARGSLDVLLATPLSTRAILLGKWCGAYRLVPWLALGPSLIAFALVLRNPNTPLWLTLFLIPSLILAYGAALTSVGLALATWISRPGRVLVVAVTVHLLITVGWFFLAITLFADRGLGGGLAEASSFFGPGLLTALMSHGSPNDPTWKQCRSWAVGWIIAYAAIAAVLLRATLATFDRGLGRVSESEEKVVSTR